MQIEHGRFTPLVMSTTNGMSGDCRNFYVRLPEISEKRDIKYSTIAAWIRSTDKVIWFVLPWR